MKIYLSIVLLIVIIILLKDVKLKHDKLIGILSLGIFVSQKLADGILRLLCAKMIIIKKLVGFGQNRYALSVLIVSFLCSIPLYVLVDRPVDKIRARIRANI